MYKKVLALSALMILVLVGMSLAEVSRVQPPAAQKAAPPQDFPQWYYERFNETLYFQDFEDGVLPEGWVPFDQTDGSHLQTTTINAYGGNGESYYWGKIYAEDDFGYGNLWEDWLLSPSFSIPSGATLSFMHKFDTESETDPIWDGHCAYLRLDGTTWQQLTPQNRDSYYDSLTAKELHCWGYSEGWTGERDWMEATFNLGAYAGRSAEIMILFVSDQLSSYDDGYDGVWIDDIKVTAGATTVFSDDAGDSGPQKMIFTGSNKGAPWEVTNENWTYAPPPNGYDPGEYSLRGPEHDLCISYGITTPWFTMPNEGYPRSSFYRMVDLPGGDNDDDGLLNDLVYVEMRTAGSEVWQDMFNMNSSGGSNNDSTFELISWNDQRTMKYHAYRGQDIQLRFIVHADENNQDIVSCNRTEPPCSGRGIFLDDFLMYWMGVPQNDIGIAYIDVPYLISVNRPVDVHIGVMNLGSTNNNMAITWFEICEPDTNFATERLQIGDPIQGFPKPMGPPYPAIAAQDTFDFVYRWTPTVDGLFYWRAYYFLPDELPEDDTLNVPTTIRVCEAGTGEFSYVNRNTISGSVPGFQPGNGPAVRYTIPAEFENGVALAGIRHSWSGTWSPYEVHVYGSGPNDSTWGDPLIEPFTFGEVEPEPAYDFEQPYIDLTKRPDYDNLKGLKGDVWVHLRALPSTRITISQRGQATEPGHDWLYFQGQMVYNTQVWDMRVVYDWRTGGCQGLRGDPTGDGSINVLDVLAVANDILGIVKLQGDAICRGDCNGDATINILDALNVANVILGIIPKCPGTECKTVVTPETVEFMKSLRSYLSADDFSQIITLVKGVESVPTEFGLAQNYPNPFNPATTINYQIPVAATHVSLKVYNVLGQAVATLVDEVREAGIYTAQWDASQMASGVYFYRLEAGDYSATRQMVLMK